KKKVKFIEDELDRADNEELRLKVDLVKGFLQRVVPTLTNEDSIDDTYNSYEEEEREKEIESFSEEVALKKELLKTYIQEYEYSSIIKQSEISDSIKGGLLKKRKYSQRIVDFILEHTKRFG
ncbi:MAG: restriction endonuclease subunit R, partial [Psychrobacillus psychrodurans]